MDAPAQWTLLHDLEMAARHVLRRRHNPIARAELLRACEHAKASREREAAEHRLRASAPPAAGQDPRPTPPPATTDSPAPSTTDTPSAVRLPYRDD